MKFVFWHLYHQITFWPCKNVFRKYFIFAFLKFFVDFAKCKLSRKFVVTAFSKKCSHKVGVLKISVFLKISGFCKRGIIFCRKYIVSYRKKNIVRWPLNHPAKFNVAKQSQSMFPKFFGNYFFINTSWKMWQLHNAQNFWFALATCN